MTAPRKLKKGDRVATVGNAMGGVFTVTRLCCADTGNACGTVFVTSRKGRAWFVRSQLRYLSRKRRQS